MHYVSRETPFGRHNVLLFLPSQPAENDTKHLLTSSQHLCKDVQCRLKAKVASDRKGHLHPRLWSKATKHRGLRMRLRVGSDWITCFNTHRFTSILLLSRYAVTQDFYWIKLELEYSKFSQRTQTLERVLSILCIANSLSEEFQCPYVGRGIAGSPWSHAKAESGQRPPSAHLTYLPVPVQLCWWWGWRGWCAADPLLDKRACRFGEAYSRQKLSLSGITEKLTQFVS